VLHFSSSNYEYFYLKYNVRPRNTFKLTIDGVLNSILVIHYKQASCNGGKNDYRITIFHKVVYLKFQSYQPVFQDQEVHYESFPCLVRSELQWPPILQ